MPPSRAVPLRQFEMRVLRNMAVIGILMTFPAILFYTYLHFSETGSFPSPMKNLEGYTATAAMGVIIGSSLLFINRLLDRRISWQTNFTPRFLVGLLVNVAATLALLSVLASVIPRIAGNNVFWPSFAADDADVEWKIVILVFVFVFVYKVIYTLLYSYQHYAIAQLAQLTRERRQMELQFEALKQQLSPHYLFNNLNTISSLVMKDLPSAEQFIRRLAQTYHYVLETQDKRSVLLKAELDFVESYYYLLRMRFQQQLHVEVNVPAKLMQTKIPPLTLQMLVENAVKHNSFASDEKMLIYITVQDNTWLKVINTKTVTHGSASSFHIGLENIMQRYKYLTEKPVMIENSEKFTVSLPLIYSHEDSGKRKDPA